MEPGYYVYLTNDLSAKPLSDEPIGTLDRFIIRDLTTVRGVVSRIRRLRPGRSFRVFRFTNFYDDRTFRQVAVNSGR